MTDLRPYIQAEENKQSKERLEELFKSKAILRLQEDLTNICNNFYAEDEKLPDNTKDTFHLQLDTLRKEFLDLYRGEIPDESLNWIYKVFGYIKTKC